MCRRSTAAPIRDGVLEWNKAFERIGYKDAIRRRDPARRRRLQHVRHPHASIRWMTTADSPFSAIGPSVVDPRTGEILDADIGIDATQLRARSELRRGERPAWPAFGDAASSRAFDAPYCTYAHEAAEHEAFAHVAARGARRDDARRSRSRGVHPVAPQGDRHARGRPHARAHAQLPRVDRVHRRAARRPRVHATRTASPAR